MTRIALCWMLLVSLVACGGKDDETASSAPKPSTTAPAPANAADTTAAGPEAAKDASTPTIARPPESPAATQDDRLEIQVVNQPWKGDLDEIIKRRVLRVLVPYSKTFYFLDGGTQRGLMYDLMQAFEASLNQKHKLTKLRVAVVYLPTSRDELIAHLNAGLGDVVAANLTVTPQRTAQVDFTTPLASGVKELLVTAPDAAPVANVEDLSGREVFVRRASSYYESLTALNEALSKRGVKPVVLREAPPSFEDEDVLEMVNAGLAKYTVVDRYLATFWSQIHTDMKVREDVVLREAGDIAFAIRKASPQLKSELDAFIAKNRRGTTFGNVVIKKYLQDTRWVKNSLANSEREKLVKVAQLFQKYGDQYSIDWLLIAAQGYQESGLDHRVRSPVGAIGIMQVMPATGAQLEVGDISQIEPNIHAGAKYIRFMMDQYYKDEPMDELNKALFAFASYNAGPNRIRSLREVAAKRGLDPNKWFNNVERVVADKVGRETVQYVSNIYKYYIAYTLVTEQGTSRARDRSQPGRP
jgi:membrane-bound lytic murein transglycosylase MltF